MKGGQVVRRMRAGLESIQGLCIADMDGRARQRGGACVQRPENVGNSTRPGATGEPSRKV